MDILNTLLISNKCLEALVEATDSLIDSTDYFKIKKFWKLWYNLNRYATKLFVYLNLLSSFKKTSSSTKSTRKDTLKPA